MWMTNLAEARSGCAFLEDVLSGLSGPVKSLPAKYFYDAEGSRLFEEICELPEYYLTRTEIALLTEVAPEIARHIPKGAALVEPGSGASLKTRLVLDAAPHLSAYVPIDISESALTQASAALTRDYPDLSVIPVAADFTLPLTLPAAVRALPLVGFFPGSTIGNFTPDEATALLSQARAMLGPNAAFLVGADLVKPVETLIRAYDDEQGVTAAFNRNLLYRINRELEGDFDPDSFTHRALWNARESRIEMHLISARNQHVRVGGERIFFAEGRSIHTENSYKFTEAMFADIAGRAGWRVETSWVSDLQPFAMFLLR
ncbi:MAG TPA: L-histidine N(alpha)-methyltransferase [Magnetospirillaceae bacterium]|nr:L-histidine N(alpha)-methyltransferase [Magnetospirillaceae bacterium]